jgi:hypothetical protein
VPEVDEEELVPDVDEEKPVPEVSEEESVTEADEKELLKFIKRSLYLRLTKKRSLYLWVSGRGSSK